jgi:hypothetical protein
MGFPAGSRNDIGNFHATKVPELAAVGQAAGLFSATRLRCQP